MDKNTRGIGLVDVAGIIVIAAVVLAIGVPSAGRAREMSKRSVCAVNLKGIGESARIYAQGHNGQWMVPAFREASINQEGIDYLANSHPEDSNDPGSIGFERWRASDGQSTALSTTRALWMLVRINVRTGQFICPSSEDAADPQDVELYYDFSRWNSVSYGYQVPFGPSQTRARDQADPVQVFIADKGPFYTENNYSIHPHWTGATLNSPPTNWRNYNSLNHRNGADALATGEGQNCFFADGSLSFMRRPIVGVDDDNIYTTIEPWSPTGVIHGNTPHEVLPPPYPGQDAYGDGNYSTTDSLIYP